MIRRGHGRAADRHTGAAQQWARALGPGSALEQPSAWVVVRQLAPGQRGNLLRRLLLKAAELLARPILTSLSMLLELLSLLLRPDDAARLLQFVVA